MIGIILIVIGVVFLIWSTFILMVREDMDLSEASGFRSLIGLSDRIFMNVTKKTNM